MNVTVIGDRTEHPQRVLSPGDWFVFADMPEQPQLYLDGHYASPLACWSVTRKTVNPEPSIMKLEIARVEGQKIVLKWTE